MAHFKKVCYTFFVVWGKYKNKKEVRKMPRVARKTSKTKIYHIILRGNDKQDIFFDTNDYKKFIKELTKAKEKFLFEIYAYCLMTNHVHLVIYDKNEVISKIMQKIQISYVNYFSKKYEKIGHLFQNRFLSKSVENDRYLINLCNYIHQNPLKAKISTMEKYTWSSYREYQSGISKITDITKIYSFFDNNYEKAKNKFIEFSEKEIEDKLKNKYIEYEIITKLDDTEVKEIIENMFRLNNIRELNIYNSRIKNKMIKEMKKIKGTNIAQLARVTGINRKHIERAFKMKKEERYMPHNGQNV